MSISSEHGFYQRFMFDFLFYILIGVVLLNIVFGIIIDTFGELRSQKDLRGQSMLKMCFVCGMDKAKIDSETRKGFQHHVNHDHNIWNCAFAWQCSLAAFYAG